MMILEIAVFNIESALLAVSAAVERIIKIKGAKAKDIQVGFIAINKQGEYGGYCIQKGFNIAACYADDKNFMVDGKYIL